MSNTDSGWRKRQIALDKMAENARELGLDYEPDKTILDMAQIAIERINKVLVKPAQQEPWNEDEWRKNNWRCGHGWLRGEQCEICNAAQEPVACLDCGSHNVGRSATYDSLINSVKTQPEQEPVVCKHEWFRTGAMEPRECRCIKCGAWNTTSPQRKPLTDDEILKTLRPTVWAHVEGASRDFMLADARAIEAAHGIKQKNT